MEQFVRFKGYMFVTIRTSHEQVIPRSTFLEV